MPKVQIKRGTRAQIDAAAAAFGLFVGEHYLIIDEDRIAVGLSTSTYETFAKESEIGSGDALVANPLSQFAATASSQLAGVISDETGSGALVFATSPTFTTPLLGTPTSGTLTNCTGYTFANIASKPTTVGGYGITDAALLTSSSQMVRMGTLRLYDAVHESYGAIVQNDGAISFVDFNGLPVSETSGLTDLARLVSPSFTTPNLGTPSSGTLTNCTGYTFANIASKPTTVGGYGITDAALLTGPSQVVRMRELRLYDNPNEVYCTIGFNDEEYNFLDALGNPSTITNGLTDLARVATTQPLDAALTALAAGSDFVQFTGPTTSIKVFTLPNASSTLVPAGLIFDSGLTMTAGRLAGRETGTGAIESLRLGGGLDITGGFLNIDPTLVAFASLTIAANTLTIGTGADAFSQVSFAANTFPARAAAGSLEAKAVTDFGLSLIDDVDGAAARTTLGLGTLATQSGTFSGTSSGTNTGDQTTIVGINGTTAQFNTALSDGSFTTLAGTETLTNKRIAPRSSTAASGDITPDLATANIWQRTAISATIAINAPTGTPLLGEVLVFMLLDDGTGRTLNWNAAFTTRPMEAALPITTIASKQLLVTAQYNGTTWLALSTEQT